MKFLKENWKMLVIVLIVAVLFPVVILTPSKYGTISYDTGLIIVGYGGSIIGGFLTLYGVWWTIKKQEEQRREDLSIQYKPLLSFIGSLESTEEKYCRNLDFQILERYHENDIPEYIKLNKKFDNIKFSFTLRNTGRGNVAYGSIEKLTIENPDIFDNHLQNSYFLGAINELVPGQEIALILNFPNLLRLKDTYLNKDVISTTINCIIEYSDEFNIHRYELNLHFTINIEIRAINYSSGVPGISIIAPIYSITQCVPFHKIIVEGRDEDG